MKAACWVFAFLGSVVPGAPSQEIQGAASVLKKLAEASKEDKGKDKPGPVAELKQKITAFARDSRDMAPEKAASQWLSLYDTFLSIPRNELYNEPLRDERPSTTLLVQSLPPSAAWPALAQALDRRTGKDATMQDGGLRLLAAALLNNEQAWKKAMEAIKTSTAKLPEERREYANQALEQLDEALQAAGGSKDRLAAFEKQLAAAEKKDEKARERQDGFLQVPDLVKIAGKEKAAKLLERSLLAAQEGFSVEGKETRRMAAGLALKHADKLQAAPWDLVETVEDMPLFEALNRKPVKERDAFSYHQAKSIYLQCLLLKGRTEEAAKLVLGPGADGSENAEAVLSTEGLAELRRQGKGSLVLTFLKDMLGRRPGLPLWSVYIQFAAEEGASADALKFLEEVMARPALSDADKVEVRSHYARGLLAADKVDAGINQLRQMIKAGPQAGKADAEAGFETMKKKWAEVGVQVDARMLKRFQAQAFRASDDGSSRHMQLCLQLTEAGRLLQRKDLEDEGMRDALSAYAAMPREGGSRASQLPALVKHLVRRHEAAQAEGLIVEELVELSAPQKNRNSYANSREMADSLALLASLYVKEGRPEDALKLFEESPGWGARDLSLLMVTQAGDVPLPMVAARALAATGRKDAARTIAERLVQDFPGKDACYELLLSLDGGRNREAWLDEVYKGDRFEERPLIWKAWLQLQAGRLDEAEKTARAAIAVDPSDGEQGKGDRMRVYAVLADILEKRGDEAQARLLRGAVEAIRISENADDWWEAGLLTKAVAMYEEALTHFADAYCIQSRLALRYSELGDVEKAEQHYRRAFELMPGSFGRVESHCFGCEHAFSGQRAQNIADKVFSLLAEKLPDKPQVFYLLGYLRQEQGQFDDAAVQFRKAVNLDPDYLNAWKKLDSLAENISMSDGEEEKIVLALFRIDPMGHHSTPSLERLHNLRLVWDAILDAERNRPQRAAGSLMPLPAAAAALDKDPSKERYGAASFFDRREDLRQHFTEHPLVRAVANYLEYNVQE